MNERALSKWKAHTELQLHLQLMDGLQGGTQAQLVAPKQQAKEINVAATKS